MIAAIHRTVGQVAASLALVAVAALISFWQRADLERDIGIATVRSFVQLTAVGYVIKFVFDQNQLIFVAALIAAMVTGAYRARARGGAPLAAAIRARHRRHDARAGRA